LSLRSLTIHGNPVETIDNFRLFVIGFLPHLKKLDTVLVSKKERDNSKVWLNEFGKKKMIKNLVAKNPRKPPEE